MKRIILLAMMLLVSAFLLTGCGGRNADFGYVNMQKVFMESEKVKDLQAQMDAKEQEITQIMENEKSTLSDEEFQQKQQEHNLELMTFSQSIKNQFDTSLKQAIDEVSQEKKLGAVLVKETVLSGGVDITEDVIKRIK